VSLVVLLLLAGCNGTLDTTTNTTATVTPEELDPADADLPPGVTESGVENASALAAAHEETLLAEGFALNVTSEFAGSALGNRTTSARWVVAPDGERVTLDARTVVHDEPTIESRLGDEYRQRLWRDATLLSRLDFGNETRYNNLDALAVRPDVTKSAEYERYLAGGNVTVERVVAHEDHTRTTLVVDEARPAEDVDGRYDARFVVDERGVVHEATVTTGQSTGDVQRHFEHDLVRLGTSLQRPDWVADAPDAAFLNVTLDADVEHRHGGGTPYLLVTNEGTDAMPAGATLNVTTNRDATGMGSASASTPLHARLRTDEPLAPGESVSVYRSSESLERTHDESVAREGDGVRSDVAIDVGVGDVTYGSFGMGWSSASASTGTDVSSGESGANASSGD
jgi:hypothetical protein